MVRIERYKRLVLLWAYSAGRVPACLDGVGQKHAVQSTIASQ